MEEIQDPVAAAMEEQSLRRDRRESEKAAGWNLDAVASTAIDLALQLAPEVVEAPSAEEAERVIDIELPSVSEAQFVRKRVNAALTVAEWLPDVVVWVWQADTHKRAPLSDRGRERGFELRLERSAG